jgi:hypothetical protein
MEKRRKPSQKQILYQELTEREKQSFWYVDLPDDRPTFGRRVSREKWIALLTSLMETSDDGLLIVAGPSLWSERVVVGSPQWKTWLRDYAIRMQRRLFWEPLESVGLTAEGARRYGCDETDVVRHAQLARARTRRAEKRARLAAARTASGPNLFA